MKIDITIQKIFDRYGITNKMHSDAFKWNRYKNLSLISTIILTFINVVLLLYTINHSDLQSSTLILVIVLILLNVFSFGIYDDLNNKESNYVSYKEKEIKIATDYEEELEKLHGKLYRKRVSDTFNKNLSCYAEIINICKSMNKYLVFSNISVNSHAEYAAKRMHGIINQSLRTDLPITKKTPKTKVALKNIYRIEDDYVFSKTIENKNIKNKFNPKKIDWIEFNNSNTKLGELGENIVLELEKSYLRENGLNNLLEKIEWISQVKGDGAGYDILSYSSDGSKKYIEVKTTTKSEDEPFYMSVNELAFFKENPNNYFIYRLYINKDTDDIKLKVFKSSEINKFNFHAVSYKVSY